MNSDQRCPKCRAIAIDVTPTRTEYMCGSDETPEHGFYWSERCILGVDNAKQREIGENLSQRIDAMTTQLRSAEDRAETLAIQNSTILANEGDWQNKFRDAEQKIAALEKECNDWKVMHRDTASALEDVGYELDDLRDCKELLRDLGRHCGCDHVESSDERSVQVQHIEEAFDKQADKIATLETAAENTRIATTAVVEERGAAFQLLRDALPLARAGVQHVNGLYMEREAENLIRAIESLLKASGE